jgi:hypothetical protein
MRWFRYYTDDLNNPKLLRLSDRLHRVWVGLCCVASQNDGKLPAMEDCALMLRLQPERMAEALVSLIGAGLMERHGDILSPTNWASRQYRSDGSAERMKRHRQHKRDVTVTPPEQITDQNRSDAVTRHGLVEVTDQAALAAWDAHGMATQGKSYPRNKRGGWCFPTKWPPGHEAEVHAIAIGGLGHER